MPTPAQSHPLISVVVPAYNYGRFIGQAIESLQAQTHRNWECIVVDDGSTDHTGEIVTALAARDGRFRYLRQENQRQAAARNNGIRHARGRYIQFLDADDLLEDGKLARQVNFLQRHGDVDIVYSNVRYFDAERPQEMWRARVADEAWMPELSGTGEAILVALVRNNIMPVNAPLLRRETIDEIGLFDERLTPVEDWEYFIRCAAAGKSFLYDDGDGVRALVRTHPKSSSRDQRRMYRSEILMRETIRPLLNGTKAAQLNEDRLAEITGLLGVEEFAHGRRTVAARQFVRAMTMDRRPRFRAKWLLCTAGAPFLSPERMRSFVNTSISGMLSRA